jgi:hypothetical protein
MTRIKVGGNKKVTYGVGRIAFSLISSPKDGRKHVLGFQTCRDYINDCLISFFNASGPIKGYWREGTDPPVDTERLRLVIAKGLSENETEDDLRKKIYAAKRIINMYEDLAGFTKKSTIARVEHSTPTIKYCWLLTGPEEWLKASNLISLITLTFRVVVDHGGFENFKTLEEVEGRFKELIDADGSGYGDCGLYLPALLPKLRMILECYDKLFRNKPFTFWYPSSKVGGWHSSGGIYCLCDSKTSVSHIENAMNEMYEIWKKEKGIK